MEDTTGPPSDWNCPKCDVLVFGSKSECFKCRTPKPKDEKRKKRQTGRGGSSTKFAHEPIMQLAAAHAPSPAGTPNAAVAPSLKGDKRLSAPSPTAAPEIAPTDTPVPTAAAEDGTKGSDPAPARRSPSKQKLKFSKSPTVRQAGPSTPSSAPRVLKAADTEFAAVWPTLSKTDRLEALSRLSQVLVATTRACASTCAGLACACAWRLFRLSSCECVRAPRKQQVVTNVGAAREHENSQALSINTILIAKI